MSPYNSQYQKLKLKQFKQFFMYIKVTVPKIMY